MRLILIRHGETDYSLARRYCGFSDPPLNDEGIQQSRQLAVRLKGMRIDKIYSSDLARARQTAEIVFPKDAIEPVADWREMNFGLFEGLTHEQIIHRYATLYRHWVDDPARVEPPEGEGLRDFSKRVREGISAVVSQHGGTTVAVVTHGGPIRIALCDALQLGLPMFWQVQQALGAWNAIDYAEGVPPAVIVMNDVSHWAAPEASVR
jgi:alpha-ribazole phosphatase